MAAWVIVGVDSSVAWPTVDTDIEFSGHKMTLRPGSKELVPTVAFEYPATLSFDEALLIVRRFLSSLAWVERSAVREEGVTGASHPIQIGWPQKGNVITHNFRQDTCLHQRTGGHALRWLYIAKPLALTASPMLSSASSRSSTW